MCARLFFAFLLLGCADNRSMSCSIGSTQRCACTDGRSGAQTCEADRHFGECICSGGLDAGMTTEPDSGPIIPEEDAQVIVPPEDAGVDAFVPPVGCSPECFSTERCCGVTCINRAVEVGTNGRSDPSFTSCNGCGIACATARASACSGSTPQCMCGASAACVAPRTCESTTGGFTCLDLLNDSNNCGSPGNRCPIGGTCSGGICAGVTTTCGGVTCAAGRMCCDGVCIDTTSSLLHCGACNMPCGPQADRCSASTCRCGTGAACLVGVPGPLGGMPGQLCCATRCVAQDASNCAMCGDRCTLGEICGLDFGIGGGTGGVCCGTEILPDTGIVSCGP